MRIDRFDAGRRRALAALGVGAGGLAALGGIGLLAPPARADTALDVQILQTASSLEALAVSLYASALGFGPARQDAPAYRALAALPAKGARETLTAFATDTMRRHGEHKKAFQARTTAVDPAARAQDAPNPKFLPLVTGADLSTAGKVVDLAAVLEKVATDTYLLNLTQLQDAGAKALVASVMAVQAQHLATLRLVGALLAGTTPQLVVVPFPLTSLKDLPQAAGSVAFPDALEKVNLADLVAEPASGAFR